ncbi:hypothetical protein [Paenibacillus sp. N3.4]|uniref:hypothetical protein n=1 Tax=Paenibacillus sp. N3.4 TaxID=2603222 RepID=UPI0011C7A11D|nr:hypothetical protein [Paenibacillus sp. N3.4]TXK83558.1 hypothetical protein FU659_13370 [Paenibacillus sp. N3.4]
MKLLEANWSGLSDRIAKGEWPVFGAVLLVYLRKENFYSKFFELTISELMEFTKSDFDKSKLSDLAGAAATQGLLDFGGETVRLKDTPTLEFY